MSLVVNSSDEKCHDPLKDLTIQARPILFQVDTNQLIGAGSFMKCYRAKLLLNDNVHDLVAKQYYPLAADLDYYIIQLQLYLHARAVLAEFQSQILDLDEISQQEKDVVSRLRVSQMAHSLEKISLTHSFYSVCFESCSFSTASWHHNRRNSV